MTIDLAQSILRKQFPSVLGLQHTVLGLRNMFTVRKSSIWRVVYSNIIWKLSPGSSFYNSLVFLHQICDIIRLATNKISVKVQPLQQQSNQVDREVFSIAFAVPLALVDNLVLVTYEQTSLRLHLNK